VICFGLVAPAAVILLFRFVDPPLTTLMLLRSAQGQGMTQDWTRYDLIPPALRKMAIASEDRPFCDEMFGFNRSAIAIQIGVWWDGGRPTGASTITMQTARSLFLWPERSWIRKALEAWLTPQIALLWPRRRVIEVYLNIAEFGPGVYGVAAAARMFWRKPASALSPEEGAILLSLLPDPMHRSVLAPTPAMASAAEDVLALLGSDDPRLNCAK
jgi:monofunctional biosynthetic peptidoglycan transglycosylase